MRLRHQVASHLRSWQGTGVLDLIWPVSMYAAYSHLSSSEPLLLGLLLVPTDPCPRRGAGATPLMTGCNEQCVMSPGHEV